ncbi:MAG: TldD/PmbA family protein [Phycisphaerae bacterium]|nr:TldD/PmbA family protein [Phycisphaerae bacterium]
MRDRLTQALRKSDAEYAEIRVENVATTRIVFRGRELDTIDASTEVGGIVRALVKGGWGLSTFNDLSDLEARVAQACESARLVGRETTQFAAVEPVVDEMTAPLQQGDFRNVPLADKKAVAEACNTIILDHHEKIETSRVSYSDTFRTVWYANTDGAFIKDERPDVVLHIGATARDGDNVQNAFESVAGNSGFALVTGHESKAQTVARRAVDLLSAPPVRGGKYTVVTNPRLTGVFAHEAFGHLSEADFVYENPQMKDIMVLGKRFGSDVLNIVDDGAAPGLRGTHRYDDEGVPTRENYLIKDGLLVGRLHSRETAAKLGESPTGNARSLGWEHQPIVRMTNTYIDKGAATFDDMIKDVKLGLYACDMVGGNTAMEMFTFSAGWGYMIRDGKIAELVRDIVLTGNVFETLMNVDMLGDTVEFPPTGGGCGKGGQAPLPVGFGGPHVRIQNVVVGGTHQ